MGEKKRWLVPVNVRYKEYYLIEHADSPEEAQNEATCLGEDIEELREYVEALPMEGWDEPEELTEERYLELLQGKAQQAAEPPSKHECYAPYCGVCPVCANSREVCIEHNCHIDNCPPRCDEGKGAPVKECPHCKGKY